MPQKPFNIALIGCGKMGSAMLQGWLDSRVEERVYVLDPAGLPEQFQDYVPNPITWFKDAATFVKESPDVDIYVMAIKPQLMADVCGTLRDAISRDKPILSIAAGQTIATFEHYFGPDQPVIRAMPNTPASIGKGISVVTANKHVTEDQKETAQRLMQAVSLVEWIEDEALLDPVTAVSGSGPAYVFLLIEVLAKAGEKAGLDADFSMKLARQTVIGSAALAEKQSDTPADILRQNVTSPGGTTEAALEILMNNSALQDILSSAVEAATQRSRDLAG